MVPPMLNVKSMTADQIEANPSARGLVDMMIKLSKVKIAVTAKMEYLYKSPVDPETNVSTTLECPWLFPLVTTFFLGRPFLPRYVPPPGN